MIRIGTIADMKENIVGTDFCENWMIVRSPEELLSYAKHIPQLSPTTELFRTYRKAFHEGVFNQKYFDDIYTPWFLQDISRNGETQKLLKTLCEESYERDFLLGCYCKNEELCHRSLVAGILLGMGAMIETEPEYIKYYHMLQKINSKE